MLICIFMLALLPYHGMCTGTTVDLLRGDDPSTECVDLGNATKKVHVGWPFHFTCDYIISPAKRANLSIWMKHKNLNARVTLRNPDGSISWSMNDTSYNLRYEDDDLPYTVVEVQENMTAPFELEYKIPEIDYCGKRILYLNPVKLPENTTCNYPYIKPLTSSAPYRGSYTLHCIVSNGDYPKLYAPAADLEYEWWYNCSTNLPRNAHVSAGKELTVSDVNFTNGGEYTCAVKYKGQSRLLARHSICVKHVNSGTYTIACEEKPEGRQGEDLNVTCIVDFGKGDSFFYHYKMDWLKRNTSGAFENVCDARPGQGLRNSTSGDPRIQCENVKIEPKPKCYHYLPSPEEQKPHDHTFRLTILIKNVKLSDMGQYVVNFTVASNDFLNHTLQISLDEDDYWISTAVIVAISAAIFLVVVFFIILCIWRRNDIRWFFKKNFGAYEKDNKTYVAYLAYHFSSEGMKELSQNLTKSLVKNLVSFLQEINATTYDDYRDGDPSQQKIESITKFQQKCHRIIIILNEEYVTDQWNMHKAYLAMRNMIEGGAQVIFIVLPGVEKSFKAIPDEPRIALKHAMKMSTTIEWSGKLPLSGSFRRQLEYALPKLKKKPNDSPNKTLMQTVV